MKKIVFAIIILVSMSATSYAAGAGWDKYAFPHGTEYMTSVDRYIYCHITEREDGTLEISASDSRIIGKDVVHEIRISKEGFIKSKTYVFNGHEFLSNVGEYEVFTKCVESVKQLPAEVRAKFHGAYEISNN